MAGGGGDGGFQARQDAEDRRKQSARNSVNVLFGTRPTAGTTVDPGGFWSSSATPGGEGEWTGGQPVFDQAGYDAAVAAAAAQNGDADRNRTALDGLYGKVRSDAYTAGRRGLDEGKQSAARDLKFELFARGLNGGSVDVDQNALLGRKYGQGLINLGGKADEVAANLRTGDENTRLTLLQSIDNGLDQGSAVSSALAQMRNNADKAGAQAIGTDLGNLFEGAGLLYDQGRRARGEQTASSYWQSRFGGSSSPFARGTSGMSTRS